ncbi:MAG: hypothetical protein P4L68_08295 [Methylovirgula sp.]|nr:hypothetical protein [Methylovirgula sp.]
MTGIQVQWLVPGGPAPAAALGTPGATWPQQLFAAGLIADPTIESATAHLLDGWQVVSADTLAVSGQMLSVDTTGGPVVITLPEGGGFVALRDNAGTWAMHNVTVNGGGSLIGGSPTYVLDTTGYRVDFSQVVGAWRYALSYNYGANS